MKFSCERCQTRYSIGDEKVKGKVLKIRCKTCGNIIVVREQIPTVQGEASGYAVPQMAAGAGGGVAPQPTPPPAPPPPAPAPAGASAADIDWYVAIKGKQHGPAKHDDIARLFRDGKITERTYLWHDKLPAWTRMKDLPEFAAVLAEGPAPKRPPPPPPEEGAEIVNFEAARAQRQQQAQGMGPVTNDPFAAIQGVGVGGGDGAPRESTRVFIMQAGLHNRAKKHRMYAGIAIACTLGFIALCAIDYHLDILGLKRVVDAVAVTTGIKEAPPPMEAEWGEGDVDPTLKCKLMPNPEECVRVERAKMASRPKKPKKLSTGASVSEDDLKGAFGTAGGGDAVARSGVDDDGFVKVQPGLDAEAIRAALSGGKGGPTGPKARIETPSVAGTSIDAENAAKVVREGQAGIQLCVDDALKRNEDFPGKLRMTLSITTKGTVDKALVNDAVVQASGLGACITRTAKKWKFAPTPEAADLEIPLVLR